MKKIITLLFLAFMLKSNSQVDLYTKIKSQFKSQYPEINLENKLIAISFWTSSDLSSRDTNKQFNKVYTTYEFAKLKGGLKGIVCISINKTAENASIILTKDGVSKLIQISNIDLNDIGTLANVVYDALGNEVYKNIAPEKIFESINKLITR